ncbi:hypothetical protein PRUB_b0598 [Pseudoalteromonas rubra]|uniref:Uncharacterized protein n=1 Tax=Pseudoalteromonas rubra TaxID=43658 RepID=A0A8T0C249_9GAMM|nr:hypothetical protein PRUB_b0598 [Pseudoalteromonas rubra]
MKGEHTLTIDRHKLFIQYGPAFSVFYHSLKFYPGKLALLRVY